MQSLHLRYALNCFWLHAKICFVCLYDRNCACAATAAFVKADKRAHDTLKLTKKKKSKNRNARESAIIRAKEEQIAGAVNLRQT